MLLRLDRSGPLYRQVYRSLRAGILDGTLKPASRLPSTRSLTADARISRTTALLAYDQLLAEGYATARRGSGTYVAAELPGARPLPPPRVADAHAPLPRLSRYAERLLSPDHRGLPRWTPRERPLPYDFRYGRPAFGDFPHALWRRLIARRLRSASARSLDYSPPEGLLDLREAIADYLRRSRAVACTADEIVVVNGSQQGLELVARLLLDPGSGVLLEEPHYAGARRAFAGAGARLVTAPVGLEGLDVTRLPGRLAAVRLAYVTPSHQFPLGVVMTAPRRLALLDWAARRGAYVVEDDYDSEYRHIGRPIESLQGLDRGGRVIYLGTFSKVLFPALRLGYLVLPRPLVRAFRAAKAIADTGSPTLEQGALADFMREGHFERHLHRSRARASSRQRAMLAALAEHFGERVEVSGADAGLHLVAWVRGLAAEDLGELVASAARAGVGVYPVTPYFLKAPRRAGLLLGYAGLSENEIRRGIRQLAAVLELLPRRGERSALRETNLPRGRMPMARTEELERSGVTPPLRGRGTPPEPRTR